jgi:hypothetical protein
LMYTYINKDDDITITTDDLNRLQTFIETKDVGFYTLNGFPFLQVAMLLDLGTKNEHNFGRKVFNRLKISEYLDDILQDDDDSKNKLKTDFSYETLRPILLNAYRNILNEKDNALKKQKTHNIIQIFNALGMLYSGIFNDDFLKVLDLHFTFSTNEDVKTEINNVLQLFITSIETDTYKIKLTKNYIESEIDFESNISNIKDTVEDRADKHRVQFGVMLWVKLIIINQNIARGQEPYTKQWLDMKEENEQEKEGEENEEEEDKIKEGEEEEESS